MNAVTSIIDTALLDGDKAMQQSRTINGFVPSDKVVQQRRQIQNDINHNINNWLYNICGYAHVIALKAEDAQCKENAERIMTLCIKIQDFNRAVGCCVS